MQPPQYVRHSRPQVFAEVQVVVEVNEHSIDDVCANTDDADITQYEEKDESQIHTTNARDYRGVVKNIRAQHLVGKERCNIKHAISYTRTS